MSNPNPIRVLIVDDHPVVREGLAAIIERRDDMTVVGEAATGREAVHMYRQTRPDVTLMDLRMPEMDGVEAIQRIREEDANARIIVLTTYDGDEDIYRGLRSGARAYLLKDAGREALLEAIRAVHAGKALIPAHVAAKLAERMMEPDLTPRELEVLNLLVLGKTNRQIAQELNVTVGTVKSHVNAILAKMGAEDRTQAATLAIKRGLIRLG
ncbi:MAG: response regulator [Chthonomonadales bacterium]